ncbi:hypothetical protein LTR95_006229 [Oleoguttula sp. CCFEE 5521]
MGCGLSTPATRYDADGRAVPSPSDKEIAQRRKRDQVTNGAIAGAIGASAAASSAAASSGGGRGGGGGGGGGC